MAATTAEKPLVFVVDDNPAHLQVIAAYLSGTGMEVCTFSSSVEFMQTPLPLRPGCILLDNQMPDLTGLQVQDALFDKAPTWPIVFMSGDSSYADVFTAGRRGAVAFLQKPFDRARLLAATNAAIEQSRTLLANHFAATAARERYASLTDREREVFLLLVAGKSNKIVARELGIALRTVEYHRANIQTRLKIVRLEDMIALARELGVS